MLKDGVNFELLQNISVDGTRFSKVFEMYNDHFA